MRKILISVTLFLLATVAWGESLNQLPPDGLYQSDPDGMNTVNTVQVDCILTQIGINRRFGIIDLAVDFDRDGDLSDEKVGTYEGTFFPDGAYFSDGFSEIIFSYFPDEDKYVMMIVGGETITLIDFLQIESWVK